MNINRSGIMETTESINMTNRFVIMSLRREFDDEAFILLGYSPIDAPEFCPSGGTISPNFGFPYQVVGIDIPGRIRF